jgi:2-haloacid dehalogenase
MLDLRRFEVLSFDCYGTLIDWETGILNALRPILASHDLFPGDDEVLGFYAEAESDLESGEYLRYREILRRAMSQVVRRLGVAPAEAEIEYLADSLKSWPPFPDTLEALPLLKKRFKLAMISNTDDDLLAGTSKRLGIEFDWAVTAEQARSYKPRPRIFEHALRRIGVPKEKILHVAQSLYHDVAPAKSFGWATVWVDRRQGKEGSGATPEAHADPDLTVPDLRALLALTSP